MEKENKSGMCEDHSKQSSSPNKPTQGRMSSSAECVWGRRPSVDLGKFDFMGNSRLMSEWCRRLLHWSLEGWRFSLVSGGDIPTADHYSQSPEWQWHSDVRERKKSQTIRNLKMTGFKKECLNGGLTCNVSSPWRSLSRLTMVCSLWALTVVFLSLVLSRRTFSRGLMRPASMEGVDGSLKTHHSIRSDTSLMSLDWFCRHWRVTERTCHNSSLHPQNVPPKAWVWN